MESTPSSITKDTSHDRTVDATSSSRGKYTFWTRLALASSAPMPDMTVFWKKLHGRSAHVRNSAKTWTPLGSPFSAGISNRVPNTTE